MALRRSACIAVSLFALALSPGAASRPPGQRVLPAQSFYETVKPYVVRIVVSGQDGEPLKSGSGVAISADSILTNYHVVEGGTSFDVLPGDSHSITSPLQARPLSCSAPVDLAILQVSSPRPLRAAPLSPSLPEVGARVYALGSPLELEGTLSEGVVSQIRPLPERTLIHMTPATPRGGSGGALFSSDGRLLGITMPGFREGQKMDFAVSTRSVGDLGPCSSFPVYWESLESALGDARPTPPTASCGPWLVFQYFGGRWAYATPFGGSYHVTGTVKNEGCGPAELARIRVARRLGGELLSAKTVYVADPSIRADEKSTFEAVFDFWWSTPEELRRATRSEFTAEIAGYGK